LRSALDRLAGGIDAVSVELLRRQDLGGVGGVANRGADGLLAEARDAYGEVVAGPVPVDPFMARWSPGASVSQRRVLADVLEAQRWRLAMYASDGWFWDDPARGETAQVLRAAARAVRIIDELASTRLERRLVEDLSLLVSPSRAVDGARLYREALEAVGQPAP